MTISNAQALEEQAAQFQEYLKYGFFLSYPDQKAKIDEPLAQAAQAAGLPADFDWGPYLLQAGQAHYDKYRAVYSLKESPSAYAVTTALSLAGEALDNPDLTEAAQQYAPGSQNYDTEVAMQAQTRARQKARHRLNNTLIATAAIGGGLAQYGAAGAGATTAGGVTAGTAAGTGGPTVIGTATGGGQFVNAAGAALPAAGVAAAPALASGSTSGGVFTPAAQGATTGAAGTAGAAGGSAAAIQRILAGTAQDGDYLSVIGAAAPGVFSAIGNKSIADQLGRLSDRQFAEGAPFRDQARGFLADPSSFFSGPIAQENLRGLAQGLSKDFSNPAGSPTAQTLLLQGQNRDFFNTIGGLANAGGLGSFAGASQGNAFNALGQQAQGFSNIGTALGNVLNPQQATLAELLRGARV